MADSAGDFYFLTFNQIAEQNNSLGALGVYQSRYDFQTDPAGTACSIYNNGFCETAVYGAWDWMILVPNSAKVIGLASNSIREPEVGIDGG